MIFLQEILSPQTSLDTSQISQIFLDTLQFYKILQQSFRHFKQNDKPLQRSGNLNNRTTLYKHFTTCRKTLQDFTPFH